MRRFGWFLCLSLGFAVALAAQQSDVKVVADTLVVQASGTVESDPDLATLTFDISSQEKDLKLAYEKGSQAIQKIVALAERNGLKKEDISSGTLIVTPFYEGDRKKRAKAFLVQGQVALKIHDFSKLGAIMEESVTDEITDFRSLTYSLADEEAAKQRAVGEAMRRAIGRANAVLEQKGQTVGALRFANVDVTRITGVTELPLISGAQFLTLSPGQSEKAKAPALPVPLPRPEKITVSATVQCGFQIQ